MEGLPLGEVKTEQAVIELYDGAQEYLAGGKSLELFENLASGPSGYADMAHGPQSLKLHVIHGKKLLEELRRCRDKVAKGKLVLKWLNHSPENIRTVMHMLYMHREFPGLKNLIRWERGVLEEVADIVGALICNNHMLENRQKVSKLFKSMRTSGRDLLSADTSCIHCSYRVEYGTNERERERIIGSILAEGFSDTGYKEVCSHFGFTEEQMLAIVGEGECLEVGPGFSNFAVEMRKRGATTWTIDLYSMSQLMERMKRAGDSGEQSVDDATRAAELYELWKQGQGGMKEYHRQGYAQEIGPHFGEGRFRNIFAHDSVFQVHGYILGLTRPKPVFSSTLGILNGLHPEGGTFHTSTLSKWFLYAPEAMQRFMLPFLLAVLAGGFEVVGAHDEDGEFSWENFVSRYTRWSDELDHGSSDLHIRRHPGSDIQRSLGFLNAFLPQRRKERGLEKTCREFR